MPDSTPVSGELSRATPEVQKYRPRACQSCARSKMRCVWPSEPGATPCQRCAKIKAPCTLPEINPRRRRGPSTRVGQLEEKIDGIMSLLNASQQIQQNSPSSSGQTPPPSLSSSSAAVPPGPVSEQNRSSIQQLLNPNVESHGLERPGSSGPEGVSSPPPANHFHTNARLIPPAGLVTPAPIAAGAVSNADHHTPHLILERDVRPKTTAVESVEIFRGFHVTFLEADRALNLYRSIYSPYFPFVTIPVMLSPYDLYEKAPFLFRTIVAVTTRQGPTMQTEFKIWFRQYVAQHVVANNEARLEILQAILVHLAWGEYCFMVATEATNLVQLATGLVIDLGLDRPPSCFGRPSFAIMKGAAAHLGRHPGRKKLTLEEMRAALGTFYVTSLCSSTLSRHHPMMYSSSLFKCCESLQQVQEYDSDRFLVALVKMQQVLNRGADIIPYSDDDDAARRIHYTPVHMALSSMQNEMEALIREQPADVESNAILWTHFHANICRLYEPVIYIRSASPTGYDPPSEATARTSALWQCLHSAREFFSAYLSIPPQNLICVPLQSIQISLCLVTMARLLFLGDETLGARSGDPDWNLTLARQSVDFETICLRLGNLFDEADKISASLSRRARYSEQERSVMGMYRDKARWIRNWYTGRIRPGAYPSTDGSREVQQGGADGDGQPMDVEYGSQQTTHAVSGDLDDSFWQVVFNWGWNSVPDLE